MKRAVALFALLAGACSGGYVWTPPESMSAQDAAETQYQCEREARFAAAGPAPVFPQGPTPTSALMLGLAQGMSMGRGNVEIATDDELLELCLKAKGFRQIPRK